MASRVTLPIGLRQGHMVVVANDVQLMQSDGKPRWGVRVECDCGKTAEFTNRQFNFKSEEHKREYCSQSCGKRWKSNDKGFGLKQGEWPGWYRSYQAMKQRCGPTAASGHGRENYFEKGVTVCDKWLDDPKAFFSDMGERPEGMTLDRKNPELGCEPGNCRWATASQQAQNKRATSTLTTDA